MIGRFLKGLPVVAVALAVAAGAAWADKSNDTLVWVTDREATIADPYYNNTRELVVIGQTAWDMLLFRDLDTGEFKPLLATSYEWIDNLTLEFELRDDVVFHDGKKFGADDVVYTINYVSNKDNGVLTFKNVSWMKSAEKLGQHKVRINLHKPFPAALPYLSNAVAIVPDGHYDDAPTDAEGKKDYGAVHPVGTGPYKITEVRAGEGIFMEANEAYFEGGPKGTPQIGKLVFRTLNEMNTQIAELLTGGVDWIWDEPKAQSEKLASRVQAVNAPTLRLSYIQFDVNGKSGTDIFTN